MNHLTKEDKTKMKKFIAVIPARMGSKGIKNKNIASLGGYPLIAYSIACSRLCKHIKRTIVTTDSPEIAKIAREYGAEVPFLRPKDISGDMARDIEWAKHFIEWFVKTQGEILPTSFVHLRPTTPLRQPHLVDKAIELFLDNPEASSLISVQTMNEPPCKVFKKEDEYLKPYMDKITFDMTNLPRQLFPAAYLPNGYVDVIRTDEVLKGSFHGKKLLAYETEPVRDLDSTEDLYRLRNELNIGSKLMTYLFKIKPK